MVRRFSSLRRGIGAAALVAAALLATPPAPAQARVLIGFGFGVPFFAPAFPFYGPPVVYGAPYGYGYGYPYGYAPPVGYPAPGGYAQGPYVQGPYVQGPVFSNQPSSRCFAGAYVCPSERAVPVGAACTCPTNGGRVFGRAG